MNNARRQALLASALQKEKQQTPSLVAEKEHLERFLAPLDDDSVALQAELRILKQLESASKPFLRNAGGGSPSASLGNANFQWEMPKKYADLSAANRKVLLLNGGIIVEDDKASWTPILKFKHFKLPKSLRDYLWESRRITEPTAIQQIALPVVFRGRDLLAVAGTGSGKTMCYLIPSVLLAWFSESALQLQTAEGPIALILVPNRELAIQVRDIAASLSHALCSDIYCRVVIGGTPLRENQLSLEKEPTHILVGTPGRVKDLIDQGILLLNQVKLLVLDEADRLLDLGFSEIVREICQAIPSGVQTLLFSATMPSGVKQFAQNSLNDSVTVYVGRAGKASKHVTQRLELVAPDTRIKFLLLTLQETPPPVVIFCSDKSEVDSVLEALLLRGVLAAAIHGGLDQVDRSRALSLFMRGEKDVLVATDVASKGLDLPQVQHVINYSLPQDIEDYVHRIGRTGRRNKQGLATSFVTSVFNESLLLDIRGLLLDVRQHIPKFLDRLARARGLPSESIECAYCGGPGHRVMTCPKLLAHRMREPGILTERLF